VTPEFKKVTALMANNRIFNSASELHGIICGYICAGGASDEYILIWHLLGQENKASKIMEQLILRLAQQCVDDLDSPDFSFELILPNDDEELGLRLRALGNWCEGFITGFGGAYAKGDASLRDEAREVLQDFTAIADIDERSEDGTEKDENDYMEIVEYVRVAVSTLNSNAKNSLQTDTILKSMKRKLH
jgi:uncharacterized protein YgfB (UPF0149 family)